MDKSRLDVRLNHACAQTNLKRACRHLSHGVRHGLLDGSHLPLRVVPEVKLFLVEEGFFFDFLRPVNCLILVPPVPYAPPSPQGPPSHSPDDLHVIVRGGSA